MRAVDCVERVDLGEVPYEDAVRDMADWVARRRAGEIPDRLALLSHPPVITYGSRTPPAELPAGLTVPLVPVDRGGQATFHGPGQLIGYLVLNLRERGPGDIVRRVENGLIAACADLGFETVRRDTPPGAQSLVGVWTPDGRKLVSIGMRIRGGVTSHGFALNITSDLVEFTRFVACGLPGVAMTSLAELAAEQGRPAPAEQEVRDAVARALGARQAAVCPMSKSGRHGSPWPGRSTTPGPGGVMKLGKALATGVAEERPQTHDEELELADEIRGIEPPASESASKSESESEEVPAAR